jgi:hypothetical protein
MFATPIKQHSSGVDDASWLESHLSANSKTDTPINQPTGASGMTLSNAPTPPAIHVSARPKYNMHRETNWSIGRTAERKGITVRDYDKSDRWLAWRKRNQKARRKALMKATKASRKGKGSKKKVQRKVAKVM